MGVKLSARQQAQLAWLQGLMGRLNKIQSTIEQMANGQADEVTVRSLGRNLNEIKAGASQLSMPTLANTAGLMGTMDENQRIAGVVRQPEDQLRCGVEVCDYGGAGSGGGGGVAEEP